MKTKPHNPYMIHVVKKLTPEPVWSWLLAALDTPYSPRECVELLPDSELAVEYRERMRGQP